MKEIKDGYYLAAYLHIDPLCCITKAVVRHDQNISLWKKESDKISLIHYWEIERLTGYKKHGQSLFSVSNAEKLINSLLSAYGLNLNDINDIWGTPELCKLTSIEYHSLSEFSEFTYHSIAHLFSSLLINTEVFYNDTIICLAVDGGPDQVIDSKAMNKKFYAGCVVKKGEIVEVFHVSSPALLWTFAKNKYKMEQGSLMALASASSSEYLLECEDAPEIEDRNSAYAGYKWLEKLNDDVINISDCGTKVNKFDDRFTIEDNKVSMVMKVIQQQSIHMMCKTISLISKKYNIDTKDSYLSISGGYALNCMCNNWLMEHFKFKGFLAPPCVSDTGQSLGMALYAFNKYINKINFNMNHPYYGDEEKQLNEIISDKQWKPYIKSVKELDFDTLTDDIIESPIIWFEGRSEIGPRALGSRSILADARSVDSKNNLNKIKQRQWWRPVAPIVMFEYLNEWFDCAYESPFMLHTFKIHSDKLHQIPAISHIDQSARVQTIKRENNAIVYDILKAFHKKTSVPLLCNTSLNDKGEPIINKASEALNFGLRKGIEHIYINGYRIELKNFDEYKLETPLGRWTEFYREYDPTADKILFEKYNPYCLSKEVVEFYYSNYSLKENIDITKKSDVEKLLRISSINNIMFSD
ncbi:MAG: nodulation protein NodU [Oscillospiraceae bacterium]|jgi:predicted NodU family carbamoyl transferase|nr:nodulation protein NodU [Oscillospiraceae bacterium]